MTNAVRPDDVFGAVARHNEVVLENARKWANAGYTVRVQVQYHTGEQPCPVCRQAVGTYTLTALPSLPLAHCERAGNCAFVYDLILLV